MASYESLLQLHEKFLQEYEYVVKLRSETLRGYKAVFTTFGKIMPEIERVVDLTPATMNEFFKRLATRERVVGKGMIKKGIKSSTVATYRNKLSKFFKWLIARKYLLEDPFIGIPYPEVSYHDRKYLKKEQVEKIFTTISFNISWQSTLIRKRNLAIFTILLFCGLRKGELIGLKLTDINLEHRELLVRGETSKSKRDRYLPLNQRVIQSIKDYFEERMKVKVVTPYLWLPADGGERFTVAGFKHLINKVNQVSGVRFHAHQFRHTFAVNVLNAGSDIYRLKQLLGHSDIRMTAVYLRSMPPRALQPDVNRLDLDNFL